MSAATVTTQVELDAALADLEITEITISDQALLYKAVRPDGRSRHGALYVVGETTTCNDWQPDNNCGNGLHLSPHPYLAAAYDAEATRFLLCRVPVTELRPIPGGPPKAKAPAVEVLAEVREVGS